MTPSVHRTQAERRRARIYLLRLNTRRIWTQTWTPIYVLAVLWSALLSLLLWQVPSVFGAI